MSDTGPRCWPCWMARRGWQQARYRWVRQNREVVLLCDGCFRSMAQLALERRVEAPLWVTDVASPHIVYVP